MQLRAVAILALVLTAAWSEPSRDAAADAAQRGVEAARALSSRGGYLWWYSADGTLRAGEGTSYVDDNVIWVQPPGTPTVGMAYLKLYDATGDDVYLAAARDSGHALAWGQLATGGWTAYIYFDEVYHRPLWYRRDLEAGVKKPGKRFDSSSLDDDITPAALRFLMLLDDRLKGADPVVHSAVEFALDHLLAAQFANGGWPQVYDVDLDRDRPPLPMTVPEEWPRVREGGRPYWYDYTLNDDVAKNVIDTLLLGWRLRGDERLLAAATRTGAFLLASRLPQPHPIWPQQYNPQMQPSWARVWEPPAATSLESVGILEALVELWLATGDEKFLAPHREALDWFQTSRLPDGTWARYYELHTNRPLYMILTGKKKYELTYDDQNLPVHYGWKRDDLEARLTALEHDLGRPREELLAARAISPAAANLAEAVAGVIASQDAEGRWLSRQDNIRGTPLDQPRDVMRMDVLADNLSLLADYLTALEAGPRGG